MAIGMFFIRWLTSNIKPTNVKTEEIVSDKLLMASAMIETLPESKPIINLLTNKNKLETSPIRPAKAPNAVRFPIYDVQFFLISLKQCLNHFTTPTHFLFLKNTIKPFMYLYTKPHFLREILLFSIAKSQKQEPPKLLC